MNSIYQYAQDMLGHRLDGSLKEFPLDSVCGEACKQIIDKANELLELCDSHPKVVQPIKDAVNTAIEIICFG